MKSVSILIPTLNAGRVLEACLASIAQQDYDPDRVEIVVADGGSTDQTLTIARRYTDRIYPNPRQTGEAGKAVALQHASGEIAAFIDSDNILPQRDWLARMVAPFDDAEIVAAEPIEYTYRRQDGYITRYCALMGMNDPLCLFLGNYDRYCTLTGKWTGMPVAVEDKGTFLKVTLEGARLPTIGANGFLVRRSALDGCSVRDYVFDIDVVYELLQQGQCKFAKVKTGIVHVFSGSAGTFVRKQRRRIKDYLFFSRSRLRKYPWKSTAKGRLAKFVLYGATVVPLWIQSLIGFTRKPDWAWAFHPFACWITLFVYGAETIRGTLPGAQLQSREHWGQ
ncbi:MAG: glycosyltransferase family 2 protein [Chloroflexi bacterium]|nr:glycosyltransferase family 2 protein [Chloroflexota bacterium]